MAKTKAKTGTKTPVHQWTHDGDKVLIVRCINKDGTSYAGFVNPVAVGETVTAPDFNTKQDCGGGIHGWAWGIGIGDGKDPDWLDGLWQVYSVDPSDVVGNIAQGIKVKFRTGILIYSGDWHNALDTVIRGQMAWIFYNAEGSASASGNNGSTWYELDDKGEFVEVAVKRNGGGK